ncbi:MAG: hypothetical protein MZU97_09570 [Bacillus subtilis]|nr:hypothetical protein [Bacillus subtilis]
MEFVRKGKAAGEPWTNGATYADLMRAVEGTRVVHLVLFEDQVHVSESPRDRLCPDGDADRLVQTLPSDLFLFRLFSKRAARLRRRRLHERRVCDQMPACRRSRTTRTPADRDQNLAVVLELALEMVKRGFRFAPIDIHDVRCDSNFVIGPDRKSLIMPLMVVDSLGMNVATSIVDARKEKPFVSKQDVKNRTKLSKTLFDRFEDLGVFKDMVDDVQMSLFDFVEPPDFHHSITSSQHFQRIIKADKKGVLTCVCSVPPIRSTARAFTRGSVRPTRHLHQRRRQDHSARHDHRDRRDARRRLHRIPAVLDDPRRGRGSRSSVSLCGLSHPESARRSFSILVRRVRRARARPDLLHVRGRHTRASS